MLTSEQKLKQAVALPRFPGSLLFAFPEQKTCPGGSVLCAESYALWQKKVVGTGVEIMLGKGDGRGGPKFSNFLRYELCFDGLKIAQTTQSS